MNKEEKYYGFQDILRVIGFDYEFDKKNKEKILKRYHESLCLLQRK